MASLDTKNPGFDKQLSREIQVVPNSATDIIAKDCIIYQIHVCNTDGSNACAFTLKDKQTGTARFAVDAESIAAATTKTYSWPEGLFLKGGATWQSAAADDLEASIVGFYKNA